MKKKGCMIASIIAGVLFVLFIILAITGFRWYINTHNMLVDLDENVGRDWAQVENVYQRRADLIPNLVNTVKGYADHEKETLTEVIEARAKATSTTIDAGNLDANSIQQFQAAQNGLSSALSKLMVVVERYPDLKANQNFRDLQAQLEGTENRIAVERRRFNETVKIYNSTIKKFPVYFVANMKNLKPKEYFQAVQGAEKVPEVKF